MTCTEYKFSISEMSRTQGMRMIAASLVLIVLAFLTSVAVHFRDDLADLAIKWAMRREPDLIIGSPRDPYMHRHFVIPKNRLFNIYLHRIMRDDDDRALHDHPWWSIGMIIRNHYFDIVPRIKTLFRKYGSGDLMAVRRDEWSITFRRAIDMHRIVLPGPGKQEAWTLFMTGPEVRDWGFWCPAGWRSSRVFGEKLDRASVVGRGCS